MKTNLANQIAELKDGDHLCLFYEKNPREQLPALLPFIREGLARDEQFIYIADDQTVDELTRQLQDGGINVGQESARGRLGLLTRKEWRQPGLLTPRRKSRQIREFIASASHAGFKGIRFAVEMTWTLGPDIKTALLQQWEATINTLFDPKFPGRIVCQYNRARLAPEVLLCAMYTHPQIILGDQIYPNMFYQAPLILQGNDGTQNSRFDHQRCVAQVEWMISQLKKAQAAELAREQLLEMRIALAETERQGERQRADDAVGRLGAIVESSDDAIIGKDLNGVIKSWNCGAERLFGYTAAEVIGQPVTILMPPERTNEEPGILARIRRGERIDHYETVRQRKDGQLVNISLTVSPIRDSTGKITGISKIARNITDRKKAEAELAGWQRELEIRVDKRTAELSRAHTQLRDEIDERKRLESEIARAVEREQLRLGQKLHDGLGQELVGITYQMSALHGRLVKLSPAEARDLKKLEASLRQSADNTRNLARDFYPVELESGGLVEALRRLAHNTKSAYGVNCQVKSAKDCQGLLSAPFAIQLFRIAQEAVHNAIKHAKARTIIIRCSKARGLFKLAVQDDGVGFPPQAGGPPTGMGLRIMRHRAGLFGGALSFSNNPTGGALVECTVPYDEAATADQPKTKSSLKLRHPTPAMASR